jgi:hypothetical protein
MSRRPWVLGTPALLVLLALPVLRAQTPEAHLSLSLTDDDITALPLAPAPPTPSVFPVPHTLVVNNAGPGAVVGAHVTEAQAGYSTDWSCTASPGSSCPAHGTGPFLAADVDLLSGGTATFRATAWFVKIRPSLVINHAQVAPPSGVVDPNPYDNQRTLWTYATYAPMPPPLRYYTLAPCRILDTRALGTPLHAGETRNVQVAEVCNVPPAAPAVYVNVTAVKPTDSGNLRFYGTNRPPVMASAVNFATGTTRANNAVVRLSYGQTGIFADMMPRSTGYTHVVIDVYGFFWNPSAPPLADGDPP